MIEAVGEHSQTEAADGKKGKHCRAQAVLFVIHNLLGGHHADSQATED